MSTAVKILYRGGTGEIEVKKSRFIAHTQPVSSEEEAQAFIADLKKEYWDARHNCYAYVVGGRSQLQRFSDDGEPSGTAGKPMLEVLLKREIHDCLVVVTRYFGGTLLGTGGLVRAYQGAVNAGLENSRILEKQTGHIFTISADYSSFGRIQYQLASRQVPVMETRYGQEASADIALTEEMEKEVLKALADATSGSAKTKKGPEICFAFDGKEFITLPASEPDEVPGPEGGRLS